MHQDSPACIRNLAGRAHPSLFLLFAVLALMEPAPKAKAFLALIAWSEGTSLSLLTKNDGYDVIVTGIHGPTVFTDDSKHPFEGGGEVEVRPGLFSTAAGRCQLLVHYWVVYKAQLLPPDYSPASQDAVAIQQIIEREALALIEAGNIAGAIMMRQSRRIPKLKRQVTSLVKTDLAASARKTLLSAE